MESLEGGKDKVMFLTKDDLSSPSTIKMKEDEAFDPWDQHGTRSRSSAVMMRSSSARVNATEWLDQLGLPVPGWHGLGPMRSSLSSSILVLSQQ